MTSVHRVYPDPKQGGVMLPSSYGPYVPFTDYERDVAAARDNGYSFGFHWGWNAAIDAVLNLPTIAYREATHSERQAAIAALRKPVDGDRTTCAAAGRNSDGECWDEARCPQIRDGEPMRSGRHCPLDKPVDGA